MNYLVRNIQLILQHEPGRGSWTYHLQIPHTQRIKGKWGEIKVSGYIDDYKIEAYSLLPLKGKDKLLAVNAAIRKAIGKGAGDTVSVTLWLLGNQAEMIDRATILEALEEAGVLSEFRQLPDSEKEEILTNATAEHPDGVRIKILINYIAQLEAKRPPTQ